MQRVRDDVLGERVWNSAADGARADNVHSCVSMVPRASERLHGVERGSES